MRNRSFATNCTSNDPSSFVGVTGNSNVAGGPESAVLGGASNQACDEYGAIGGGESNGIGNNGDAAYSFIGGGQDNQVTQADASIDAGLENEVDGLESFIGAGDHDEISGYASFVGAGQQNVVSSDDTFVGGGQSNTASADYASILGGNTNTASGEYASVDGGNGNTASGEFSLIVGGNDNKAQGAFAIVAGGADNQAVGVTSFAAGYHADATHNGSFVWSDEVSGSSLVKDSATNQFVIRASGGTYIYSSETLASGVKLAAGSGTWSSLSDRNAKTNIVPLDDAAILAKVASLPVDAWQYKTEHGVRHVGPMAQDFYAAFGVGEDDRHITSIDEDGVALAAIKALEAKLERKDLENRRLAARLSSVETNDARLARRLEAFLSQHRS